MRADDGLHELWVGQPISIAHVLIDPSEIALLREPWSSMGSSILFGPSV